MKELNIGASLIQNRRRRGITQEMLARYLGVSKASVSKWETGTTYPDITILPKLATFFHISIDELIGYEPQMTKEDIRTLYRQLCRDFSEKPFEEVTANCREIVKKYFSCPPLLFQIGCLYANHCTLAGSPERFSGILEEAVELFIRVREESRDVALQAQAVNLESFCLLQLGRSSEALSLLSPATSLLMMPEPLIASAYRMQGKIPEAKRTLQAGMYQSILALINLLVPYLELCGEDETAFAETCARILTLAEAFRLETLHPGILLTVYLNIAQQHARRGNEEAVFSTLECYANLALSGVHSLKLHGDSYFNLLDDWLEENLALGNDLPRDETAIRKSITDSIAANPVFAPFAGSTRFQNIIRRLKNGREDLL